MSKICDAHQIEYDYQYIAWLTCTDPYSMHNSPLSSSAYLPYILSFP